MIYVRAALIVAFLVSVEAALPTPAQAQEPCPQPIASFQSVQNSVQLIQATTRAAQQVSPRLPVCAGDTIQVGDHSRAVIVILATNTPLVIDQNSVVVVTASAPASGSVIELLRGALLFITRVRRQMEVRTPFVSAAVEGTEFVVRVDVDRTTVTVLEGVVRASNAAGALLVGAGQQAVAAKGQAPLLEIPVRPRDAVQWALHYEPLFPADTFEQLAAVPVAARDAAFYVRRAAILLAVGQLEEAQADLAQALVLAPDGGDALGLRAIVAVARNDRATALDNARAAVQRSPQSAAAYLALSYALQADFQLDAARAAVIRAVDVVPDHAGLWARLAELRLALDDVEGAASAAERAVSLSPDAARGHAVRGFTSLARLDIDDARREFERAIELGPSDPFSRLGLGLARIREGNLEEGRRELEVAVALNPDNALIRSYVGKAYAEEGRHDAARSEFARAQELDPLDPTPWFYDAIAQQARNRPVEALQSLQRSIELNGNRAVYRSQLLVDSDLAIRGARLGRIFRDLGFGHLALVEGSKSLALAPSDYSAHRLLADTYLVLPRHEIARDSELLQAQLLQPLNINPVQPLLADDALFLLGDPGVSGVGYNEFTSLFAKRDLVRLVVDGSAGQLTTRADNAILSGVIRRFSYSVGQSHYRTDGIRENNDSRQNALNVFLQAALSPATSLLAEIRRTDRRVGDQRILFDPANFVPDRRSDVDATAVRVGGRHEFAPGSMLIGTYTHRSLGSDFAIGSGFEVLTDEDADVAEVRYLLQRQRMNVTAGAGHYRGDRLETRTFGPFQLPPEPFTTGHANAYLYVDVNAVQRVTFSAGVGVDRFDDGVFERRPVNPKAGLTWVVNARTTLRAAAFRTFQRTLISSQTVEPTQIAGFNQFFDDAIAADAWRYSVAVDRRLGAALHAGVELTFRTLTTPTIDFLTGDPADIDSDERVARGYLYAAPVRWLAAAIDYGVEHFRGDAAGNNPRSVARSTTHRLGGEGRLFARWGGFARVRGTFVDGSGDFRDDVLGVVVAGADRFFTLDASVGYRLPRQRGVVAVEARNLADSAFDFQDTRPEEPTLLPRQVVTVRLTVAF
jgi:tetratricopeptide (TPR) repeat protein